MSVATAPSKPTIRDRNGRQHEVNLSVEMYAAAFEKDLTLPQYLARQFDTDAERYGTPFEQLLQSTGIFLREDRETGLRPPTVHALLNAGQTQFDMAVVRPDGSQALTIPGRVLFPAVILEMVNSQLLDDNTAYEGAFNSMVAVTQSYDSPRIYQPLITLTAPRSSSSRPIAQMAEPTTMATISLSQRGYTLPTYSIGLEISDEAAKAATIDLVGIALREQAIGERASVVDTAIQAIVSGDADLGLSALSSENASTYDSAITSGTMTNKGWIKWLRKDWKKLNITDVWCDLDTFLAIQDRTGRPTIQTDAGNDIRLTSIPVAMPSVLGIPERVNFFTMETTVLGANTLVGLDRSKGIKRMIYAGASYSAIEQYVMRRSSALRIDWSLSYTRLFDTAFKKLVLA